MPPVSCLLSPDSWLVCQLGAREHFAIPRALLQAGLLGGLCTDVWSGSLLRAVAPLAGSRGRAFAARWHPGIPSSLVKHWTGESLLRQLMPRHRQSTPYERFIDEGEWFGGKVRAWLKSRSNLPTTLFSYDTTALEPFGWAKDRGVRLILGQMDPGRLEADLVARERESWPGWEAEAVPVPEAYHERRAEEWELADKIIVNSKWSCDALVRQGVPPEKLAVIPLVYESPSGTPPARRESPKKEPLRLLFLGQVNLRKGIPYLLEAARLAGKAVEVTIVGPIQISEDAVSSAPPNVRFTGPVSRSEVAGHYQRADAFVLPTISDGFAITQLEAMAHGLPVIATPNCGEVVTHGVDGLIVPARDAKALAEAILSLAGEPANVAAMSAAAFGKSRQFSISRLAGQLAAI